MYASVRGDEFSPRRLTNKVLRHVLVEYTDDVQQGRFPSEGVRKQFRPNKGSEVDLSLIRRWEQDHPESAQQRESLVDLWSETQDGSDLHPSVFRAFGVDVDEEEDLSVNGEPGEPTDTEVEAPPNADEGKPTNEGDGKSPPEPAPTKSPEVERLEEKERALNDWRGGANLSQSMVGEMRELVHASVVQRIDWDSEGLSETFFAGSTRKPFRETSIDFTGSDMGQDLASRPTRVQLELPLGNQSPIDIVMALQGLLRYQHHGDWQFPNGVEHLRTLARCVDQWADAVVDQLRRPTKEEPAWNPAPAAAELLAVRARMGGARMDGEVPLDERVDALFQDYDLPTENRGRAWSKVVDRLDTAYDDLVTILEAHAWLRKGAQARTRVHDVARFGYVLDSLQHHATLQAPFFASSKSELREEYRPLYRPRRDVDQFLNRAIEEEMKRRQSWVKTLRDAFGSIENIDEHVNKIDEALSRARDESEHRIFGSMQYDDYRDLSQRVRETSVLDTARSVKALLDQWNGDAPMGQILTGLGDKHELAFDDLKAYVELATSMLGAAHDGLASDVQTLQGSGGGVEEVISSISDDLDELDEAVRTLRNHTSQ